MKSFLIIFHSQSGRNQQLALSAYQRTHQINSVKTKMLRAVDVDCDDLMAVEAVLFIAPENFSAIAGGMKSMLDRVFYPLERLHCKPLAYAIVIATGNDGSNAERQFNSILTGLRFKKVQKTQFVYGQPSLDDLAMVADTAEALVEGLALGVF